MCVILEIQPGVTIPHTMLFNAIHNNEDGYGLVIKHKNSLEVIKKCPENGTTVKEIQELLEKHVNHLRYLHLRHRTEGEITLDNCHPYTVYQDTDTQIEFMHNGTMHEYRPLGELKDALGAITREADLRSDSKIFVETVLSPMIDALREPNYCDPIVAKLIGKMWPAASNRGLIISNKYPTLILNAADWKLMKDGDIEFRASNDTYFKELVRGRLFDKLEADKKAKEAEARTKSSRNFQVTTTLYTAGKASWPLTRLKDIDLKPNNFLGEALADVLSDFDLHSDHGLSQLSNLTEAEIYHFVKNSPMAAAGLLTILTSSFTSLYEENEKLADKHNAATKMIGDLKRAA